MGVGPEVVYIIGGVGIVLVLGIMALTELY